jgi:phage gpG-like protein
VTVDLAGLDVSPILDVLEDFKERAGDFQGVLPIIAGDLVTAVSDVFEAEGPGWAPLAESTLLSRRGEEALILQDTGNLAGTISPGFGADWAEAFSPMSYAIFHVTGTSQMPKRNPFEFPEDIEADLLEEVADVLARHVTDGG